MTEFYALRKGTFPQEQARRAAEEKGNGGFGPRFFAFSAAAHGGRSPAGIIPSDIRQHVELGAVRNGRRRCCGKWKGILLCADCGPGIEAGGGEKPPGGGKRRAVGRLPGGRAQKIFCPDFVQNGEMHRFSRFCTSGGKMEPVVEREKCKPKILWFWRRKQGDIKTGTDVFLRKKFKKPSEIREEAGEN